MASEENLNRGERRGRGQAAERYGEWLTGSLPALNVGDIVTSTPLNRQNEDNASRRSNRSRGSRESGSGRRSQGSHYPLNRKKIEAELRAAEAASQLLEAEINDKKKLIQLRRDLEIAKLEEDAESDNSQELSDDEDNRSIRSKLKNRTGRKVASKSPSVSSGSTIHDMLEAENSVAINKIAEALAQTLKIVGDQAKGKSSHGGSSSESARRTIGKDLTPFDGNPEDWPAFVSEFNECTVLCKFTDRENLQRLKKSLKGKAKESVKALLTSPVNVKQIIETLELRFGRPEYIVEVLIEKAKKIPPVREDKFESIMDLATAITNLATMAESLKCDVHMANPQLLKDLLGKLPASWKVKWASHLEKTKVKLVTVKEFASWINKRSRVLSHINTPTFKAEEKIEDKKDRKQSKTKCSVMTTKENEENVKPPEKKCCDYCKLTNHYLQSCFKFQKLPMSEKQDWVRENQVCFRCLKSGHRVSECKSKNTCGFDGCTRNHHPFLHGQQTDLKKRSEPASEKKNSKTTGDTENSKTKDEKQVGGSSGHSLFQNNMKSKILYKIVPIIMEGPLKSVKTHALLDEASAFTLVDSEFAKKLGISGEKNPLSIKGVGDIEANEEDSEMVSLTISDIGKKSTFVLENVRTKKNLGLPNQSFDVTELPVNWRHIKKVKLESLKRAAPSILIGLDNIQLITTEKLLRGPNNCIVLGKTKLGWTVYGKTPGNNGDGFALHLHEDEELHQLVKESFQLESDGVRVCERKLSNDNERSILLMEKTTRHIGSSGEGTGVGSPSSGDCGLEPDRTENRSDVGNPWETGLIWKEDNFEFPESKSLALKRLTYMERKMDRDPNFAKLYCQKINYYLENRYARKLSLDEAANENGRTWYLPHFGVVNPNKPGKLRFVFDAAAKSNGISLNDKLLTGPDLLVSLPATLIKFRQKKIGFSGDIKDFFHRIRIQTEDQPSQRFLWRGMDRNRDPDIFVMNVSIFGAACSPFTSQAVKNKNAEEFGSEFPKAMKAIIENHYMDDYLDSVDTEEEATQLIQDVVEVHSRGNMLIEKFSCSSRQVLETIPVELRSSDEVDLSLCTEINVERVLGLQWDSTKDDLSFNLKFHKVDQDIINGKLRPTKRQILKVIMSMFDPLGFLGNYTVQGKILLREVWQAGLGWDDELPEDLTKVWNDWISQLKNLANLKIPRCYESSNSKIKTRELHTFCDASQQAYAAAVYLRTETEENVESILIMAKTRVAPVKPVTIPRLELQATVLGSRLAKFVMKHLQLEINSRHFWTDSKTVMCWIRSEARNFKTFVAHRVGEILEITDVAEWKWIPTTENVADEATRNSKPADLSSNCRWINGPEFLKLTPDLWPQEREPAKLKLEVNELDMEFQSNHIMVVEDKIDCSGIPKLERFSSWTRLVRCVAWVLRFKRRVVENVKLRRQFNTDKKMQDLVKLIPEITVEEFNKAEIELIKVSQGESFADEIRMLKKGKEISRSSSLLNLSPYLDEDGILRMKTRILGATGVADSVKLPVILHHKHYYTKLLVMYHHQKAGHHGFERVVNDLRQKFWITKSRVAVKNAWSSCQLCKNKRARPNVPEMGQLPSVRLTANVRPFFNTGMDYFGPMEIVDGRKRLKVYGCLFTCLSTRAVHMEIAESLTTDSAIMAIRRFVSRRGNPRRIYSDNGTNFRGADVELRSALEQLDQNELIRECTPRGIEWHFIPAAAPHMGGSWERLVQSVKKALKSTLKERAPSREVLSTLLMEAENTVNSHPLTHVSLDSADEESLTPNHFLIGSSGAVLPPGDFDDRDLCLKKRWRIAQQLASQFWRRWIKEYLPTLTRKTKWNSKVEPVKVGDVVIVVDDQLERNCWPRGIIMDVFPGKDGQTRVVNVKVRDKVLRRPVAKICVLDVVQKVGVDPSGVNTGGEDVADED